MRPELARARHPRRYPPGRLPPALQNWSGLVTESSVAHAKTSPFQGLIPSESLSHPYHQNNTKTYALVILSICSKSFSICREGFPCAPSAQRIGPRASRCGRPALLIKNPIGVETVKKSQLLNALKYSTKEVLLQLRFQKTK